MQFLCDSPRISGFYIVRNLWVMSSWHCDLLTTQFQGSFLGMKVCSAFIHQPSRTPGCFRLIPSLCHRAHSASAPFGVDQETAANVSLNLLKQLSNVTPKFCELVKVDEGVDARVDTRGSEAPRHRLANLSITLQGCRNEWKQQHWQPT